MYLHFVVRFNEAIFNLTLLSRLDKIHSDKDHTFPIFSEVVHIIILIFEKREGKILKPH